MSFDSCLLGIRDLHRPTLDCNEDLCESERRGVSVTNVHEWLTPSREIKSQGLSGVAGVNRLQTTPNTYRLTENWRVLAKTSKTHNTVLCAISMYRAIQGAGARILMHVIFKYFRVQPPLTTYRPAKANTHTIAPWKTVEHPLHARTGYLVSLTFPWISPTLDQAFDHKSFEAQELFYLKRYQPRSSHQIAVGLLERKIQNVPDHILEQMLASSPYRNKLIHKSLAIRNSVVVYNCGNACLLHWLA